VTDNMQQLQTQARRSYRYWPVLLILRMRHLEQHVTTEQLAELPLLTMSSGAVLDVSILTEYGLPTPDQLPSLAIPELEDCPAARSYFFRVGQGENYVTLDLLRSSDSEYYAYEVLRMTLEDHWYLQKAVVCLDRILADLGPSEALRQAKLWSLLHDGMPQSWAVVPQSEQPLTPGNMANEQIAVEQTVMPTETAFSENGNIRKSPGFTWKG
jgi:hypothetical protein